MNLYSDCLPLENSLKLLTSEFERKKAAIEIKNHVEAAARELSLERFGKFEHDLFAKIFGYLYSTNLGEKFGGVLVLKELVECTSAGAEAKIIKIANALATVLKSNADFELIELIANTFGHMARNSPISHVDFIESELTRALEWLRAEQPHRKFAACIILQELAENAPSTFFTRIRSFFDLIWTPLFDVRDKIRFSAAKAIAACLAVLCQRTYHLEYFCHIYNNIHEGLKKGTAECIHGSLLAVREMLVYTGDFMMPRFKETCKAIMQYKDHKSKIVRGAIAQLLPDLAEFCPDAFAITHLDEAVEMLVKCSKSSDLRAQALYSTGHLCLAVTHHLLGHTDDLLSIVRESLLQSNPLYTVSFNDNSGTSEQIVAEALKCIANLVQGLGSEIHSKVTSLLDLMFVNGITNNLIDTLAVIVRFVPSELNIVQEKLLNETTTILGGNSKIKISPPDHVYSWARQGVRVRSVPSVMAPLQHMIVPKPSASGYFINNAPAAFSHPALATNGYAGRNGSPPIVPSRIYSPPPTSKSIFAIGIQKGLSFIGLGSKPSVADGQFSAAVVEPSIQNKNSSLVVLSLKTLGSLTLPSHNIIPLLINSVLPYFQSPYVQVRREAAITCAHMLSLAMVKVPFVSNDEINKVPYGITAHRPVNASIVSSTASPYVENRKKSAISSKSTSQDLLESNIISPRPQRNVDTSTSGTLPDNYPIEHRHSAMSSGTYKSLYSRVNTPVDRLGGSTTPNLSFSSKRYINIKPNIYTRGPAAASIDSILLRLIQIIVSDPQEIVRKSSLRCILSSPIFDVYLSRKFHIDSLLYLLADEIFDIRIDALQILGRLAFINPALILPQLRVLLIRLVSEMTNSADNRQKEEAILMICRYLNSSSLHITVKSYVGTLIKSLPLSLDVRLTTASLACIGEMCRVMREDMSPYFDELLPIIVKSMQDQTSRKKQEIATVTLGLLVGCTGKAVEPYHKYPQLLPRALDLLIKPSVNTPWSLRMETLRCIGLLGALEPQKYNLITSFLQNQKDKKSSEKFNPDYNPSRKSVKPTHPLTYDSSVHNSGARDRSDSQSAVDFSTMSSSIGRKPKAGSEIDDDLIRCDIPLDDDQSEQPAYLYMYSQSVMRSVSAPVVEETKRRSPHHEDYYPRVTITALMKILYERSLMIHHPAVAQSIINIFRRLEMKSVPFLEEVVPYLLHLMRVSGHGLRESLLQQFTELVSIVQFHITSYLPAIFEIIHDFWHQHLEHVLCLVEKIAVTAYNQFDSYFIQILPLLLSSICVPKDVTGHKLKLAIMQSRTNASSLFKPVEQILSCCNALRAILIPHLHLVIPTLCKLMSQLQEIGIDTIQWQVLTIRTIRKLCTVPRGYSSISDQSYIVTSRLVHCLTNTISICLNPPESYSLGFQSSIPNQVPLTFPIYTECIHTLCSIGFQIGPSFITFDSLILRTVENKGIDISEYLELSRMLRSGTLPQFDYCDREIYRSNSYEDSELAARIGMPAERQESDMVGIGSYYVSGNNSKYNVLENSARLTKLAERSNSNPVVIYTNQKMPFNQQQLARAWDASQRSTASDWIEWFRRLKVELIRESPNPALRACSALCQAYPPLANELFHAAFVSCWYELSDQYQDSLVRSLQIAFRSSTIPPESLQTLLNLAEFMEHDVEALPISLSILAELAQKGHAYAKALHYRELEFQSSPATCFESLITINKKLDQYDAAVGILTVVANMKKQNPALQPEQYNVHESWLAKLGQWNEALVKYEQRLEIDRRDGEAIAGKLKCLDALGRWEEAISLCNDSLEFMRYQNVVSNIPLSTSEKQLHDSYSRTSGSRSPPSRLTSRAIQQQKRLFTKAAVIGARAAWSLNEWDLMDNFVTQLPSNNIDASFMRAVLAIHRENYVDSTVLIEQTRRHLDASITALLAESYGRAYVPLIMVQQCSELEEIAEYKILMREAGLDDWSHELISAPPLEQASTPRDFASGKFSIASPSRARLINKSPLSPRSKSAIKLADLSGDDGAQAISNEQSQQFSLQIEARRRKNLLVEKWRRRLKGCCSSGRAAIPVWKYLLNGRRMILNEREDVDTWLEFATLCRNGGNSALAERVLQMTQRLSSNSTSSTVTNEEMEKKIKFAMLKQEWAVGGKVSALQGLEMLIQISWPGMQSHRILPQGVTPPTKSDTATVPNNPSLSRQTSNIFFPLNAAINVPLLNFSSFESQSCVPKPIQHTSRNDAVVHLDCLLVLGEWKVAIMGPDETIPPSTRREVLTLYRAATVVDPHSYQAWHQWGLANVRAIDEARSISQSGIKSASSPQHSGLSRSPTKNRMRAPSIVHVHLPQDVVVPYTINAIDGLMKALSLGTKRWSSTVTEDLLCIMLLWFRYGHLPEVADCLEQRLSLVHLDTWLGVLPQLIARIDHPCKAARELLHKLLIRLGEKHAQALVYPLSVALKSPREERQQAAETLMQSLKQHSKSLIEQALLVSQELIRVAILWQEEWHENLEEASRQYFGEGNIQGMLDTLIPLHLMLQKGPVTHRETNFINTYGTELNDAWQCVQDYLKYMQAKNLTIPTFGAAIRRAGGENQSEETYLHQAWDLYYNVFKRINTELASITSLELQFVSPALLSSCNLDLGVPGTYTVSGDAVRIQYFGPTVGIIRSKQRPRKIRIYGSNGEEFVFLLKGHEDLRQDERAMQLFGLVNALLQHDSRTGGESHDLNIQRYAVIPLSPSAGLISWVPNSDTLHDLIRDFRETRKIMLNMEHKIMMQLAPNNLYDFLTHPQKLEVFEHALANTDGDDLAKILWLKSETSEIWLHRRTNFTRSLAVMSMVGYVLGLGDRHPSNLMLDRKSGKVLHIDFGDCFEVAMQREKFPEKVPFRLTRMLIKAMEVSGIEGSYRLTCEKVMTVLRENRDSLIAVLEAFVHDPLLSWRLLNTIDSRLRVDKSKLKDIEAVRSVKLVSPISKAENESEGKTEVNVEPVYNLTLPGGLEKVEEVDGEETEKTPHSLTRGIRVGAVAGTLLISQTSNRPDLSEESEYTFISIATSTNKMIPATSSRPLSASVYRPNLHLEMNELANSATIHASVGYSLRQRSVRCDSIAERLVGSIHYQQHLEAIGGWSSTNRNDKGSTSKDKSKSNRDEYSIETESEILMDEIQEELKEKAVVVIRRVKDKLTGLDFYSYQQHQANAALVPLDVPAQVNKLIQQATSSELLCQGFFGWCPFW